MVGTSILGSCFIPIEKAVKLHGSRGCMWGMVSHPQWGDDLPPI